MISINNSNGELLKMIEDFQNQVIDNHEIESKQLFPELMKKISISAKLKEHKLKKMFKFFLKQTIKNLNQQTTISSDGKSRVTRIILEDKEEREGGLKTFSKVYQRVDLLQKTQTIWTRM